MSSETQLVVLGATIALVSSLVSLWVQHRFELKRQRREEAREQARAKLYLEQWQKLNQGIEHEPVAKVVRMSEQLVKRLESADLSSTSTDKLIELLLACQQHIMAWSTFHQTRIESEAKRIEATRVAENHRAG